MSHAAPFLRIIALGVASCALCACGSAGDTTPGSTSAGGGGASSSTASSSSAGGSGTGGTGGTGGTMIVDADGDGLDDAFEAMIAASYLPYLSVDAGDGCPLGGIVYRVHPHPDDAALIHVIYDHLYEKDCGLNGHIGDNEAFGVTIDPSQPPPAGIVAIRAVGHQNTICEQKTECGRCPGQTACDTTMVMGAAWPVVFASKDKHANYALLSKCNPLLTCLDTCSLAPVPATPPMVNAGEPEGHLTEDLTANGFIDGAHGWTEATLMNVNPWDTMTNFGGAGNIAGDLVDPAFVPPACP